MLANGVTPAQRRKADGARSAFAGDTVTGEYAVGLQVPTGGSRDGLAELERGAGWCIYFVPVMHFNDLDIVGLAQATRRELDQLE